VNIHLVITINKHLTRTGKNPLGIEILEEKYQLILRRAGFETLHLSQYANRATIIQSEMRKILNQLAPYICTHCKNKCCEGFPLEGWFSLEDYILFRLKYGKPIPPANRVKCNTACYFLTPEGCSLPEDMRPFTCVKINCEKITEFIKSMGKAQRFNQLKNALDKIHSEVSSIINTRPQRKNSERYKCKIQSSKQI